MLYRAIVWLMYMAVERYLRRRMPQTVIAWSRALAGRWRDPMVGRDVLMGVLLGVAMVLAANLTRVVPEWLGLQNPPRAYGNLFALDRTGSTIWYLLWFAGFYVQTALELAAVMVLLRTLLRRRRLAANVLFLLIMATAFLNEGISDARILLPYVVFVGAVILVAFVRFGLLTCLVGGFAWRGAYGALTIDTGAWYFSRSLLIAGVIAALALYGAIVSMGNKPMFDEA